MNGVTGNTRTLQICAFCANKMIYPQLLQNYTEDGVCIVPGVLAPERLKVLQEELEAAIDGDAQDRPDAFDLGMVHNCMFRGVEMAAILDVPIMSAYLSEVLAPSSILYAYQSSSLPPSGSNYGTRIHVDAPRFIDGYTTNVGVIFPLTNFTEENGGTYYLPGSQRFEALPGLEKFNAEKKQVTCSAGDMILFNARLAHSAGENRSTEARHALTLNFCRCFMRQRFDFSRMISPKQLAALGEDGRRLIGWNVRMPTSLDQFYLPADERLYKPNQE